ncbi:serine hydrolase domain-containing protein [Ketogulonicigenium vulgare]|uniref:Penicillin binding protein n=1 Tax=Ketogulonicigenium vulgare (strain WSH-001) TaxID=759362 RepID=F9YBP4_KETVW|nr:serine hydrolase domain-containing protein [Ketogulonicigenium vulgare]AEM42796.1 Penicillin binding protein [Ketogulonicigenium vulgare WSH-001]ALJ82771.1 penicillin-binding protein [Ketogulonicigenium vulgare]
MAMLNWDAAAEMARNAAGWEADQPGGAIILFDTAGLRDSAVAGVESLATMSPISVDSIMRYASVTKHVFASFVLAHPAVISLDDPLSKHLPQLNAVTGAVTVGRALDMSGGIPDTREALSLLGLSMFNQTRAPQLLDFHAAMPRLNYETGTEVHYSNGGYRLVEEAMRSHGLLFDDFLRATLREKHDLPLHASEMWTDPVRNLSTGYWHDGTGWKMGLQGMHLSAAGSLSGSGRALAEWGRLLLRGEGDFAGRLAALSAPRYLTDGRPTGYGLGLRQQAVGALTLVGHGGSQPGYRSYLLLDPATGTGCAIVANRDDVNPTCIATDIMAALLGEKSQSPESTLTPGLYVASEGADWLAVSGNSVTRLDDAVSVYPDGTGGVDSLSPTSRLQLRMEGDDIVGLVGHASKRYRPVAASPAPSGLAGIWRSHAFGAVLEIAGNAVIMGTGPLRRAMPLHHLGGGRFLFTLEDGPSQRKICLHYRGDGRIDLALARARMIEYEKAPA